MDFSNSDKKEFDKWISERLEEHYSWKDIEWPLYIGK